MDVASVPPSRTAEFVRQTLLVALIMIGCTLSMRAEFFVVASAALTIGFIATSSGDALWRAWRSIDRSTLVGCVTMASLWAYGFTLGLWEGYPRSHVLRNFFGLAFFLPSLFAASVVVGRAGISRIAVRTGLSALILLVVLRVGSIIGFVPIELFKFLGVPVGLADFGLRVYSFGAFPIFGWQAMVSVALYQALGEGAFPKAALLAGQVLLIVAATMFVTESKGILLGAIAVLAVPLVLQFRPATHARYALAAAAIVVLQTQVIMPGTTYVAINWLGLKPSEIMAELVDKARLSAAKGGDQMVDDDSSNPVETIFGAQSLGNAERYAQAQELLDDVVPFGHGLGAPITSGYSRSVTYPYGFELSFLNVIHKFGVFSLFYFAFLLYSGYRILTSQKPILERSAALGLLGYTFPAIGNPVLFAVQAVFIHMLALHGATRRRPA